MEMRTTVEEGQLKPLHRVEIVQPLRKRSQGGRGVWTRGSQSGAILSPEDI